MSAAADGTQRSKCSCQHRSVATTPVLFCLCRLCKARLASGVKKQLKAAGYKDKERVLTTEDLTTALREVSHAPQDCIADPPACASALQRFCA